MTELAPFFQSRGMEVDVATELAPWIPDFHTVFQCEFSYVYYSLARLGVHSADLEDLTHEVFLVVHLNLSRFDARRAIRPWLFGIAFRVASDFRRLARNRREVHEPPEFDPADTALPADEQMAAAQARDLVLAALDGLDLDKRAVLVMHDIDQQPVPVIAEVLAIPLNTAYSRLRLARSEFKTRVQRLQARRGAR